MQFKAKYISYTISFYVIIRIERYSSENASEYIYLIFLYFT